MKKNIIIIMSVIVFTTGFTGCKKFLDVNTSPNIVKDVNVELLLPSAIIGLSSAMGNEMQANGSFWAQYWTQSPLANQYKSYDQFQMEPADYNFPWSYFYSFALQDLNKLTIAATAQKKSQYVAISKLLTAYGIQVVTDAWGDVPFSDALKGGGALNNVAPKYDSQESIYAAIIKLIEEADVLIDENATIHPDVDDLIYGGDMAKWRLFGNTLKLKVALRLSEVNSALGKSLVEGLVTKEAEFISSNIEEAKVNYIATGGNQNPLYSFMVGTGTTQNIYGSSTCIDLMNSAKDPRVSVFYTESKSGTYTGLQQGAFDKSDLIDFISPGGIAVGAYANDEASATAPVKFISGSESLFLQAEAAARGWGLTDAQGSYIAAIKASMESYQVATADVDFYLDSVASNAYPLSTILTENIKAIITQKYMSMCGNQGFEAWTEWRRTGYPNILVKPKFAVIGNQFPGRFLYPASELTLNANFPGTKSIAEKVWWDKN